MQTIHRYVRAAAWVIAALLAGALPQTAGAAVTLTVTRAGSGAGVVNGYPVACGATCTADFAPGTSILLRAVPDMGSQFTGWLGPCTGAGDCQFTINAATTVQATFAPTTTGSPRADADGTGSCDALTDGLLVLRERFGLGGNTLTNGAVGMGATRSSPSDVGGYLTDVLPALDVDGDGHVDALTDGLLVIRYLFGLRGTSLIAGAVGPGATRTTAAAIEPRIQALCQPPKLIFTVTVVKGGNGTGQVAGAGNRIDCGSACRQTFEAGTAINLAATPHAGMVFESWGGACAGNGGENGSCNLMIFSDLTVTATFTAPFAFFSSPYSSNGSVPPSPSTQAVGVSTKVGKADLGLLVDTTSSMSGVIANLKIRLASPIHDTLSTLVTSLGIGVAAHDDFPYNAYGTGAFGDKPFYLPGGAAATVTTVLADSQTAVTALALHDGSDLPESQVPALYHMLTGSALTWPTGTIPAVTPPAGTYGALQFRADALPIVVEFTDAAAHNGRRALDKTGTLYDTTNAFQYSFTTYNVLDAVTAFTDAGARYVGIVVDSGARALGTNDPYGYQAYLADKTKSYAPPSALGGTCTTGVNLATVAADGPTVGGVQQCRMVLSISSDGTGLGPAVVKGVSALLASAQYDLYVQVYNDPSEVIDVVGSFIQKIEPDPAGGTDSGSGTACATFPAGLLADQRVGPKASSLGTDGVYDTITQTNPGPTFCFKITAKANTTVASTGTDQFYKVWVRVLAVKPNGAFVLGPDKPVVFYVPPAAG